MQPLLTNLSLILFLKFLRPKEIFSKIKTLNRAFKILITLSKIVYTLQILLF